MKRILKLVVLALPLLLAVGAFAGCDDDTGTTDLAAAPKDLSAPSHD
jgi:hypothetical protein